MFSIASRVICETIRPRETKNESSGIKAMPIPSTMSETTENTATLRLHESDTGSADVQIALLTERITHLTDHMSANKKDLSSRRGLLRLVARRRKLLDYLARTQPDRYQTVLSTLGLRR